MRKFLIGLVAALGFAIGSGSLALAGSLSPAETTLTTGTTTASVTLEASINSCTVTIPSTATFGGGTVSFYTLGADSTTASAVTGFADLGNPSTGVKSTTASGTWSFPITAKKTFEAVLTGATSPSIPVYFYCTEGVISPIPGNAGTNATDGGINVHNVRPTLYTWVTSSAITTVSSLQLAAGVAGESIEVVIAYVESAGTESGANFYLTYGNCAGTPTALQPQTITGGTSAGLVSTLWSGNAVSAGSSSVSPAAEPETVPAGQNLCGTAKSGATIDANFAVYYYYDTP